MNKFGATADAHRWRFAVPVGLRPDSISRGKGMTQPITPTEQVERLLMQLSANTPEHGQWNWLSIYQDAKALADIAEKAARQQFDAVFGKEVWGRDDPRLDIEEEREK
jgi:hypothetical protein